MDTLLTLSAIFLFIALSSKYIGNFFSKIGLPYITGYLLAGMVAGPFILGMLPKEASSELRYIDELSLAVIAFVAGSELYLKEIRSRLKSIGAVTGGVLLIGLLIGGIAFFILTNFLDFAGDMNVSSRIAIALLGGTILLALSPASTIAVIKEVKAKGSFTRTLLGVTVTMDVVIILLFAVSVAIASALMTGMGFDITFILVLLVDLGLAIVLGYLLGKIISFVLASSAMPEWLQISAILALGYGIFFISGWLVDFTHDNFIFEVHVEALLVAMIAGFYVTNYTPHRKSFDHILHVVGPWVYVAFFTLTGVGLKLDILLSTLPIAMALFLVRMISIGAGSWVGSTIAGESPQFKKFAWLGLITQAGIALGLAREVALEFPALGDSFATMVISVVVLNEIFGPMLLKFALKQAGETNLPQPNAPDGARDALIFGIESQSLALARQLQANQWHVIMVDNDKSHVERLAAEDVEEYYISDITYESIKTYVNTGLDAAVIMLPNDVDNLAACELAYGKLGIKRLIVRPNGAMYLEKFRELGALIVDPASAMVNLLDQSVRATQSIALLLHQDSDREFLQVTVSNPQTEGMLIRDLRLPNDVLLLDVNRKGQSIVPNGYTQLHLNDEITLVGRPPSLEEATLRLGF